MKLFSLVLVALAACTVSTDEVQHLRGEKEAPKDEDTAVGVAVKETAATQEDEGPADAEAIGVPEKALESSSDDDVDEGVELTLEELDAAEAQRPRTSPPGQVAPVVPVDPFAAVLPGREAASGCTAACGVSCSKGSQLTT
eukprot:Skav226402  [mRNA]  locus=scaffold3989:132481:133137:- [translate_table: standard]